MPDGIMTEVAEEALWRLEVRRALRFGLVGASQNLLNLASFAILVRAGAAYLIAAVLAAVLALAASFWANRRWTFDGATARPVAGQAVSYGVVFGLSSLWALGTLAFLREVAALPEVISQALSLLLTAPLSYLGQRTITFSRSDESASYHPGASKETSDPTG